MIDPNVFAPEHWHDFSVTMGGGAAALAGLVFVAMSINLKVIAQDVTHRNRALGTLTGFSAIFLICAFGLLGNQSNVSLGVEWLVVSLPTTFVYVRGFVRAARLGKGRVGLNSGRTAFGTACYTAQIAGAILLVSGNVIGLYIAAVAMVVSFSSRISGAWLLIIGIQKSEITGT